MRHCFIFLSDGCPQHCFILLYSGGSVGSSPKISLLHSGGAAGSGESRSKFLEFSFTADY
jgi:hypothetical protein